MVTGVTSPFPGKRRVNISSPTAGVYSSGVITATWSAIDGDGDGLEIIILYSDNDGVDWTPVGFSTKSSGSKGVAVAALAGSSA